MTARRASALAGWSGPSRPGSAAVAPFLLLAWGNRSRGDDALGPSFLDQIQGDPRWTARGLHEKVEVLEDFQLQPEHVCDMDGRVGILFVDAAVELKNPFEITDLIPVHMATPLSHHMPAGVLLGVFESVFGRAAPPAWQLAIRAHAFGLGNGLSPASSRDLNDAVEEILNWLPRMLE